MAPIVDCLKYYIVGYLTHQITKRTSCQKCKFNFTNIETFKPEGDLINFKSKSWLKLPNHHFYQLMSAVEDELMKHLNNTCVFEDTVKGLIPKFKV